MGERHTVVVGIDGSIGSRAALRFALEDAARRGTGVRVVSGLVLAQHWPHDYAPAAPPAVDELKDELRASARRLVDDVVAAQPGLAAVPAELEEIEGWPAKILIEESREADLLVVGHRGRGGFTSAVLGSVGLQCVLHAECPVVVVRPDPQPETVGAEAEPAGHRAVRTGRDVSTVGPLY